VLTRPRYHRRGRGEVLQKQAARSGNSGSCWCGGRTVGSAPDENRFTMSRRGEMRVQWCRFRGQKGKFRLNITPVWKPETTRFASCQPELIRANDHLRSDSKGEAVANWSTTEEFVK
jgi:hypothetical protein